MKCIRCGTEISEESEKCPKCETPTVFSKKYHTIHYENRKYENSSSRKLFLAIVILLIVIGLGFFVFYLYNEYVKKNNGNTNYVTDSIDYSKKSLVESNARHYMDAIEMYVVYHIMDANDRQLTNRIYSLKNKEDLELLNEMQVKVEKPVDGWLVVDRQGMVVAAELKFKSYKKAVGFTIADKVNAVLDVIADVPTTMDDAIAIAHQDILKQNEQK